MNRYDVCTNKECIKKKGPHMQVCRDGDFVEVEQVKEVISKFIPTDDCSIKEMREHILYELGL